MMERLKKSWWLASAQMETLTSQSPKTVQVLLYVIVIGIAVFRLATISVPSLEWTSWKEIDYLTISQNFWKNGFNFLQPEVTWPAEPPRVTEMELPLVPYTSALFYQIIGYGPLTARAITLIASLLMIVYVMQRWRHGRATSSCPACPPTRGRRVVLLDNWNEFGEGHFLMPSTLAGFGYVDAMREVFTSGGPHKDQVPTEAQKHRFTLLYPRN